MDVKALVKPLNITQMSEIIMITNSGAVLHGEKTGSLLMFL